MMRLQGWETRLSQVVDESARKPYVLGVHDCARFACLATEAITGVDHWPAFSGYTTKREALVLIARRAGTLKNLVSKTLEQEPRPVLHAGRGDILLYKDSEGEHLGVCLGPFVATLGPSGLHHVLLESPMLQCSWRVG